METGFMLVLLLQLFVKTSICLGADTISANQSFSGDQTIVSIGEVFELGFFNPGNSSNYYIGIWYKKIPRKTVVWVANREKPVFDRFSSELKISDGNLVLFNESKVPIWSTNVKNSSSSPVQVVLQYNGNLVLNHGSNSSTALWQSFDNPTDTFLPGSKIGYNKLTKTHQSLTSWKNPEDPAPGLFSFQLDTDHSLNLIWNNSKKYGSSGPWNGRTFSKVPEMRPHFQIFVFRLVSNENETYFTYSFKNTSTTILSRSFMDVSGKVKQESFLLSNEWELYLSQPTQQCEVYAFCGVYGSCNDKSSPYCNCLTGFKPTSQSDWDLGDYSGGCSRITKLQCGNNSLTNGEEDGFLEMRSMSLPENKQSLQVRSFEECESSCLINCSCSAYAYDHNGCSIWTVDLLNLKQLATDNETGSSSIFIRLAATELRKGSAPKWKLYILLFGIIAATVVMSCIASSVYYLRRRNMVRRKGNSRNTQGHQAASLYKKARQITDFIFSGQLREEHVPFVPLESILAATDNFSDANKLGQGGFGPVYKGKFPGGQEIAIKRLSNGSGQGLEECKNEVLLIAKLQHRNLVKLLGYCVEGNEQILLYEYMPNKSLDLFLFDQKLCVLLNWEIRLNIIFGIARGLVYLHHDSRLKIIHRDLKASNVLLDEELNPKISDFGLARIFGEKQTEANTNRIVGTYGYMSPEYALDGLFSIKSDVFSFGVVTLEIITGKRNTRFYQSEETLSLIGYVWKLWNENKALDLIDATLKERCNAEEFLKCVKLGLLCVQQNQNDRPTMSNAVVMLRSESESLPNPKQPAFTIKRSLSFQASSTKPLSNNGLTNSLKEGQ